MPAHPNRSKLSPSAARNPKPVEIMAAREKAGLNQTEAAALLYSTQPAWQRWEQGERPMHPAFWELFRLKTQ